MSLPWTKRIETVANLCTIVLCIAVFAALLIGSRRSGSSSPSTQLSVGAMVPSLPGVPTNGSPLTILVVLSPHCHYCKESNDFYAKLSEQVQQKHDVRVYAVVPKSGSPGEFDDGTKINIRQVFAIDQLSRIHVTSTPTIVAADTRGRVIRLWQGRLSSAQEHEVLSYVKSFAA